MDSSHALSPGLHDVPPLRLCAECRDFTSDETNHRPPVSRQGGSLRGKDRALPSYPGAEVTSRGRDRTIVFIRRCLAALRLLFPVLPGVGKSWVERAKKDMGVTCELCRGVTRGGVSQPLAGSRGAVLRVWGWGPPRSPTCCMWSPHCPASRSSGVAARDGAPDIGSLAFRPRLAVASLR